MPPIPSTIDNKSALDRGDILRILTWLCTIKPISTDTRLRPRGAFYVRRIHLHTVISNNTLQKRPATLKYMYSCWRLQCFSLRDNIQSLMFCYCLLYAYVHYMPDRELDGTRKRHMGCVRIPNAAMNNVAGASTHSSSPSTCEYAAAGKRTSQYEKPPNRSLQAPG